MNESIIIRRASLLEMDTAVAIDDDACTLCATVDLRFDIGPEHPFARAEYARWCSAVQAGNGYLAWNAEGSALGLLILGHVDGAAHLE